VRTVIQEARDNGAYKCAPKELAMAESHADFTEAELDYGNYYRAKEELEVADENSRLAFERSPKDKCAPKVEMVATQPKQQTKIQLTLLDTDHDGIPDKDDKCPTEPEDKDGFQDEDGCPDPDNDMDGILDKNDKCPMEPEDKDGFEDDDGCPDPDNDKDGILDKDDACPNEPGPVENKGCPDKDRDGDGIVDRLDKCPDQPGPPPDGCPVYNLIVVKKDKIELKEKVHFATDKYQILSDSFAMLNEVADVLNKNAQIDIRIEGHTDSRASRKHNMKLSQDRANSVKKYLEARGVDGGRMDSIGYGPDRPIDDNRTAIGRENNRRVEFYITKQ
jgi:outer membrane protein OmpA-like peptidoglycan-associated protein